MKTKDVSLRGTEMKTFEYGNPKSDTVLIQPVDEHDLDLIENEIKEIRKLSEKDFLLIALQVEDWNRDLSPWEAPSVFGKVPFKGQAQKTLEEILSFCKDVEKKYVIGGYSLAGLFSLWASTQSDVFSAVAAASPSVWYPGFMDFLKEKNCLSKHIYISLGDKEEKTKNQVMAQVGNCIRETKIILEKKDIDCTMEWNEGNHFKDSDLRTAKAFAWTMKKCE